MRSIFNIIVTELAEQRKEQELCWMARSETEAKSIIKWLHNHGIKAKIVTLDYFKGDWK